MRRAGIIATNEWNYCDNCRLQRAEAHNTLALHVHPDAGDASPREVFRVQLMSFLDESDWRLYRIRPNKYKSAAVARRLLFSLSVPYLRRYYMKFNCKSYLNAIDRYLCDGAQPRVILFRLSAFHESHSSIKKSYARFFYSQIR